MGEKPTLWNVFTKEYKDRVKKSEAWREVAAKLQRNQTEVCIRLEKKTKKCFDRLKTS